MRKILVFWILLGILLTGCTEPDGHDLEGNAFSLAPYKDKWLIVNYWAPWCAPCLKELPVLNKIYREHSSRVVVIGVNFDDLSNSETKTFARVKKLNFPLLKDFAKDKWGIGAVEMLPTTFIFSPDHQLFKVLKGPQTGKALLEVMGLKKDQSRLKFIK